jgi:S-DNA-T family DNA segregation ATPase FtsK/SpoIIIE
VSSQIDSRTILDETGAEKLLGKGDMLYSPIGTNKPVRVQGAFVTDEELNKIVSFIKDQELPVEYAEEVTEQALSGEGGSGSSGGQNDLTGDELFPDALRLVLDMGQHRLPCCSGVSVSVIPGRPVWWIAWNSWASWVRRQGLNPAS